MNKELLDYYAGDDFPGGVWEGKYAIKNIYGKKETSPKEMHLRMAEELWKTENAYIFNAKMVGLSKFGAELQEKLAVGTNASWVFGYLDRFKWIIPQGSIMTMLGNKNVIGSLSNCFVIPGPVDSYGGIFKSDQEIAQLEKRRGGVGTHLNNLRPEDTPVLNAAGTSTGAHSFMSRYSNTTREVAQNGRRGALMLLMSCLHPDIFKFVKKKADLTQVTGANVSVMLTDAFLKAAMEDKDFVCRFPIDTDLNAQYEIENLGRIQLMISPEMDLEYNKLKSFKFDGKQIQLMKIHAKELMDLIVEMAWQNGEPGVAFTDVIVNYSPEGVYKEYKPVASNPCGEQWMQAYDACRLLALNYYSLVKNPYTDKAELDYKKLYEVAYVQQRLADDIVDLEIKHVERIIDKIKSDPQEHDVKLAELNMWIKIKETASNSRRTGCGFTGMGDMLAALGLKYDSNEAIEVIKKVAKEKMRAELDCTIDLAIQRGPFKGWDPYKEFDEDTDIGRMSGKNDFYSMLLQEFPEQCARMYKYGRRNVSWSTVAPTGTVSIVGILKKYANLTAGIEPMFNGYYFRNKKVNPSDEGARVDFVDQNGDSWQTFPVIMGGFREWIDINHKAAAYMGHENLPKEALETLFKKSPYYGSCANDIDWKKRIQIQSIVQRYTTNAISSTLNLPNDVKKEVVQNIYEEAWKSGLKGVTVYRDGCRTGVLTNTETKKDEFSYSDSIKRPKELKGDLHITTVKGDKYAVIIGLYNDKPYEVFAFKTGGGLKSDQGVIKKIKKGHYDFIGLENTVSTLEDQGISKDEAVLTRLISGMLRHGAQPKFVADQIDKCDLEVVSYGKAIGRVLNKYVPKEVTGEACPECGGSLRKEEGCTKCSCGYSKC